MMDTSTTHPAGCALDPATGTWTAESVCDLDHLIDHDAPFQRALVDLADAVPLTEMRGVVDPPEKAEPVDD